MMDCLPDTDRASTLVHVGYVKTATTFLQRMVFSGVNGDFELAAGAATRGQIVHNILLADDYSFDAEKVRNRMEAFAAPVRARGKLPVWSEEMLLGNPPSPRYDGFSNARKIHAVYPDAKVLITIRRQQSMALSLYREYVLGGGRMHIESFIGTGEEPVGYSPVLRTYFLHYDRAISHYRNLFGAEKVLVLPQEMLAQNPAQYIDKLSEFTGYGISADIRPEPVHVGESYPALALRRRLNRLVVKESRQKGRQGLDALANRIVRLCNRLVPVRLNTELARGYRSVVEARYNSMFADSNREVARMTDLNLADYGYDMP